MNLQFYSTCSKMARKWKTTKVCIFQLLFEVKYLLKRFLRWTGRAKRAMPYWYNSNIMKTTVQKSIDFQIL